MNLEAWLQQIESLHSKSIDLGLERIAAVAEKLGITQFTCPMITVGGTNGKGSCVKFLESILSLQGYSVATYTSPHLISFNERIRINNQNVADTQLIEAFEKVDQVRGVESLTFFEFTTLAALWLFQHSSLDVVILEVGLGGRLDAVNIIDADIAIVASVDFDHMDWLGTTREEIGFEKAGIFRNNHYAVVGDLDPPNTLLDYAATLNTQLFRRGKDFDYQEEGQDWTFSTLTKKYTKLPLPNLPIQNAATSLMALELLAEELPVSETAIKQGLAIATLAGRFQRVANPACVLDVAHNEASAKLLAEQCRRLNHQGRVLAVVGMLADKDIVRTLQPLQSLVTEWYFGSLHESRGAPSSLLASSLEGVANRRCNTYDCVAKAYEAACLDQTDQDLIVVFGSFYTVAEVLKHQRLY